MIAAVEEVSGRLDPVFRGQTADGLQSFVRDQVLKNLHDLRGGAADLEKSCRNTGADIEKGKIMMIVGALLFLATVVSLLCSVFGAFAVPATIAAARVALQLMWVALRNAVMQATVRSVALGASKLVLEIGTHAAAGAGVMGGLDLTIQAGQDAAGQREGIDWKSVEHSFVAGAVAGGTMGAWSGIAKSVVSSAVTDGVKNELKNVFPELKTELPGNLVGAGQIGFAVGNVGALAASNPLVSLALNQPVDVWQGILGGLGPYHGGEAGGTAINLGKSVLGLPKAVGGLLSGIPGGPASGGAGRGRGPDAGSGGSAPGGESAAGGWSFTGDPEKGGFGGGERPVGERRASSVGAGDSSAAGRNAPAAEQENRGA
ncbi:hypothetical protein ACFXPA_49105, partial [Amycolatopsis sp. NPDC059090]